MTLYICRVCGNDCICTFDDHVDWNDDKPVPTFCPWTNGEDCIPSEWVMVK